MARRDASPVLRNYPSKLHLSTLTDGWILPIYHAPPHKNTDCRTQVHMLASVQRHKTQLVPQNCVQKLSFHFKSVDLATPVEDDGSRVQANAMRYF